MSNFVKEYTFKNPPGKIEYFDDEPFKLNDALIFYHNKSKFRRELNRLQEIFKTHTKTPLIASAIRDTYLKEEYSKKYFVLFFTTQDFIKKLDDFIAVHENKEIKQGSFLLENKSDYMLLLARDMKGLVYGVDTMEEIFQQTFNNYFAQKKTNDFIKIRPFKMS